MSMVTSEVPLRVVRQHGIHSTMEHAELLLETTLHTPEDPGGKNRSSMAIRRDFPQITWSDQLAKDSLSLIRRACEEDLHGSRDWTTASLVPPGLQAQVAINAREEGIAAGMHLPPLILAELDVSAVFEVIVHDGERFAAGQTLGRLQGSAAGILTAERTILNFLGRLCGIATLAGRYVRELEGLPTGVYDTRKTTPGWRKLEKYAVACGGARNHREALDSAVLIKDNHLALAQREGGAAWNPARAVEAAREYLARQSSAGESLEHMIVEIEVDSLDQLRDALAASPEIVLLDNMPPDMLRQAVALRNALAPAVELEASGGVRLETIRAMAEAGVDRISVGAMTHSAVSLDLGLDWVA